MNDISRPMKVPCPICGAKSSFMSDHPETDLYRCTQCGHAFSHIASMREIEQYESNYFDVVHKRWFENPNIPLFQEIASAIPQGASVLDAGCGHGDFLRFLQRFRPDLHLSGIDLSPNTPTPGIRFLQGDILKTDLGERFDVVVSLAVIEHVGDLLGFIERLHALTKPGGLAAVMTLNEDSLLYALARTGKRLGIPLAFNRLYSHHHLNHFTRESLRRALGNAGFSVESEIVHNVPLAAVDIPVRSRLAEAVLRCAIALLWKVGDFTGRSYLQTIFVRPSRPSFAVL